VDRARSGRGAALSTPWIAALVAALLLFWALGAYNRLVELRNAIAEAWTQAAEALERRTEALSALLQALRAPLGAEAGALEALATAQEQATRAAAQMNARPLQPPNAAAWLDAESRLNAAATRVFALADAAGLAAREPGVAEATARWRDCSARLAYARQWFNDTADAHDAALHAFPTSLLVRLFGFGPAGRV
jgi:LemA protein